jgi:hypothetical protein
MSRNTEAVTARVPSPMKRELEDLAEETGNSQSAMVKDLIKDGLEAREEDTPARSVSPLTILGVVAIAIAPTLLATGYTGVGAVFGAIAATYVLLWATATDVVVEERLAEARDRLRDVGGVVGFFRYVVSDHQVENPDTVVERAARLDLVAGGLLVGLVAVLAPLGVAASIGVLEPFLSVIGTSGVAAIALAIVALAYAAVVLMGVSALASLALASTWPASSTAGDAKEGG